MLEAAGLPLTLWGEAVLTAAYLWNWTESTVLPPGKTPYKMVNNKKPDLSHLHIFGSRCWVHIPTELQSKLGPKSRQALFMGYPEGVEGYHLHDTTSGTFFIACDVIFNEDLGSAGDEEDEDEDEPMLPSPLPPTLTSPATAVMVPGTPATFTPTPAMVAPPPAPLCKSSCAQNMTTAGKAYAEECAAVKAHLDELRNRHALVATQVIWDDGDSDHPALSEGVTSNETMSADSLEAIESNNDVPDIAADVAIGKQAHVIKEQAHIAIRSDKHRDPSTPDYDMSIPPATYEEAML